MNSYLSYVIQCIVIHYYLYFDIQIIPSICAVEASTDIKIFQTAPDESPFMTTNISFWYVIILWALLRTIRLRYSRILLYFPCFTIGLCFKSGKHLFLWVKNEILIVRYEFQNVLFYCSIIASECSHWTELRNVDIVDILTVCIWRLSLFPLFLFPSLSPNTI